MIEPSTRLRRAVLLGDVALVQRIIKTYPKLVRNPDFEDKANTSLHLAAIHGYDRIAAILITAGHEKTDISRNTDHETPLMLAARHAHIEVATLLVKAFPHCVPFVNKEGIDALALSCQKSAATSLVNVLLAVPDYAASPHSRDLEGNTPLHHASASGSLKALRILLAAGGNPLAQNNHDWTPLHFSASVASEVYFKNLVAEFERKKVEGARLDEERERQRAAGVRLIENEVDADQIGIAIGEDDSMMSAETRIQWSPEGKRRPATPASFNRHDWRTPPRTTAQAWSMS